MFITSRNDLYRKLERINEPTKTVVSFLSLVSQKHLLTLAAPNNFRSKCVSVRKNFCFAAERSFSRRRPFCRRARFGSACCNECDDTLRSHPLSLLIVHRSGNVALLTCPVCQPPCKLSCDWKFLLCVGSFEDDSRNLLNRKGTLRLDFT